MLLPSSVHLGGNVATWRIEQTSYFSINYCIFNYIAIFVEICLCEVLYVSLFTSIPLETARAIVLDRLSNDCTLEDCTNLTISELTEALDICLTSTYFTYNNKCYEQIFGTPMGSSLSPVIANMVMEDLKQQALSTFHNFPSIWVRYVDDVYAIVKTENVDAFHKHLNRFNSSTQFTLEMETSGSIAFLDVLLTRESDGSLSTSIFRKPTHTDRYLPFNSHHPFSQKVSTRTLYSRAEKSLTMKVTESQN